MGSAAEICEHADGGSRDCRDWRDRGHAALAHGGRAAAGMAVNSTNQPPGGDGSGPARPRASPAAATGRPPTSGVRRRSPPSRRLRAAMSVSAAERQGPHAGRAGRRADRRASDRPPAGAGLGNRAATPPPAATARRPPAAAAGAPPAPCRSGRVRPLPHATAAAPAPARRAAGQAADRRRAATPSAGPPLAGAYGTGPPHRLRRGRFPARASPIRPYRADRPMDSALDYGQADHAAQPARRARAGDVPMPPRPLASARAIRS